MTSHPLTSGARLPDGRLLVSAPSGTAVMDLRVVLPSRDMDLLVLGQRPPGARPSTIMVTAKSGRLAGVRSAQRVPAWDLPVRAGVPVALPEGCLVIAMPGAVVAWAGEVPVVVGNRLVTRYDVINDLIREHGYKSYLEIGVANGNSFRNVSCPLKHGVDPNSGHATHRMTSDEFFAQNKRQYDIVFVDGLHLAEQCLRDIENSLRVLSPGGSIVVHDCLPKEEKHQLRDRGDAKDWTGDAWKAIAELRFTRADLSIHVVDCDWGCAIIQGGNQELMPRPTILDWAYFVANKESLMNLPKLGIIGAYHVAMMNDWVPLVMEQEARLIKSGLLAATGKVIVGIVGKDDPTKWRMSDELARKAVIVRDSNLRHYEHVTLGALQQEAKSGGNFKAWYVHTKGVSGNGKPACVRDWRRVMEHFVIDRFGECVVALDSCDACGINLRRSPPHFSGNFWWANAGHLRRLPVMGVGERDRGYAESWIGMSGARLSNLHSCEAGYNNPYPESKYVSGTDSYGPGLIFSGKDGVFTFKSSNDKEKVQNNGLASLGGRLYMTFRRHVQTWITELDESFRPVSPKLLLSRGHDARLFIVDGRLRCSYASSDEGGTRMNVCGIDSRLKVEFEKGLPKGRLVEKNWQFFQSSGGATRCVYDYDPFIVLEFDRDFELVGETRGMKIEWPYGELRGSTPPFLTDGLYRMLVHSGIDAGTGAPTRHGEGGRRRYLNGIFEFDENMDARPPSLLDVDDAEITFPCGFIPYKDGFAISYGYAESCARIRLIGRDELLARIFKT